MYAGIESSNIDLGTSGALPQIQAEVQGKFGLYPTGDADFADMIEDVFKSGVAQAAIGDGPSTTQVEHGLSGYSYPGCIQLKNVSSVEVFTQGPIAYNLAVTEGNYLIVIGRTAGVGGGNLGISDTLTNTWTPILTSPGTPQVWYAQANASGLCSVTISGLGFDWHQFMMEVSGADTLDSVVVGVNGTSTVTTTNIQGQPGYMLSIAVIAGLGGQIPQPIIPLWENLTTPTPFISFDDFSIQQRTVNSPGTYSISIPPVYGQCILAFKGSNPPTYPDPVGDFIDADSLGLVRAQCRANGLWGSLSMNSQQAAADWLKTLYQAADTAPVFVGFKLFSAPLSEVSKVANGIIYNAPTAGGPSYNLNANNGDFVSNPPITMKSAARVDLPNVLQMQCLNRTSNYNPSLVEQPDAAGISLFGIRKADPIVNNAVQDVSIARQLLGIAVRNLQYASDVYTFTLSARWCLLAPMGTGGGGYSDAVLTITDPLASMNAIPVRLTSITEQTDGSLECEAIPFIYGMNAPSVFTTDTPQPFQPSTGTQVALGINPPIIFEPTPRLAKQSTPAQIWIVTSNPDANYGGCVPYVSTDGGLSYVPASQLPVIGSAAQGDVYLDWPAASDPDTTNNLTVDLIESAQTLSSYSTAARDNFQYPCYVGWPQFATSEAAFTVGDTTQITSLGVLFSNPIAPSLPPGASIVNIFPVIIYGATPADPTATTNAYFGTGMTPTSGGTSMLTTVTGVVSPPAYDYYAPGIGGSLTGQEIRWALGLPTNGGAATKGAITGVGWAIYYSAPNPFPVDNTLPPPFNNPPPAGFSWAWSMPQTVATGTVGTGSNASVQGDPAFPPAGIGYEIMSYNSATLLGSNIWQINATGGGNEIRRGVFGAPSPGVGMDHPPGSPFALLSPANTGLVKINMDPTWVGVQLWFKFPTYNSFGGGAQSLGNATAYPYTPTGIPGNSGPSGGLLVNGV